MAARRKKACCSACARGHACSGKRKRSPSASPISSMTDAQLRRFTARNPRLLRGKAKDNWIRAKIRLLRHERYGEAQAVAIALHMAGVPPRRARPTRRKTTTRRSPRRRATARRRNS